jgi:hypothetical protein
MKTNSTGPDSACSAGGTIGFEQRFNLVAMKAKLPQLSPKSCTVLSTAFQRRPV